MGVAGLSGKLITKEKARGSEPAIGSESVIRMGSDREKGKECGGCSAPRYQCTELTQIQAPHYHKTASFIKV